MCPDIGCPPVLLADCVPNDRWNRSPRGKIAEVFYFSSTVLHSVRLMVVEGKATLKHFPHDRFAVAFRSDQLNEWDYV